MSFTKNIFLLKKTLRKVLFGLSTKIFYFSINNMLEIYNFFVYFVVSLVITLLLTFAAGQLNLAYGFDYEKFSAYECGFDPFEHTRFSFDVRFYLVAIFYIIFDLEVIFFFPLSLNLPYMGWSDFMLTNFFIFFLFAGIVYEFWYGKLDWSLQSYFKILFY
jgi:NADH:ubiquinone oxidoreductase subunit 3 (subunit A)